MAKEAGVKYDFHLKKLSKLVKKVVLEAPIEKPKKFSESCPICVEEFKADDFENLKCGHSFHPNCIKEWLSSKTTCPYCRK